MNNEIVNLTAFYYDGRKDDTLKQFVQNGQIHQCLYKEEHYVVISEPGDHYVSHITPEFGKAFDLFQSLYGILQSTNSVVSNQVVGADSTNVNTGSVGGVIYFLESAVGRPLHWFIGMLHTNELPLRHLFKILDGPTSGSTTFFDVIGKRLNWAI